MSAARRRALAHKSREMFFHGYNSYMEHAYPADELMPMSCRGRVRGVTPSRGDVDDALGHFQLTLIDSLDALVLLSNLTEFTRAAQRVERTVSFDTDIVVSTFEVNIRVLGGLLGAHAMVLELQRPSATRLRNLSSQALGYLRGYSNGLLHLARDLGDRLLRAFSTPTGLPYSRINLRHGVTSAVRAKGDATCTACAGTMVMEFGALSRYTGDPRYEDAARQALQALWTRRGPQSNLVGTTINITTGQWLRRDAGVGAGTDSYYEYLFKAWVLFGDRTYLNVFNTHYDAIMQYVRRGPYLVDTDMNNPRILARRHMDALQLFFPGLQVLKGDVEPARETHAMYTELLQRHRFVPESYTQDFKVNWAQHPLRPELAESTYFLHRATGDPLYLTVGSQILAGLETHARVKCGFAAIKDVRGFVLEDQMDSFVLAETFKYLYLLFSDDNDLPIALDDYIFTTEAHLLPLALGNVDIDLQPFRSVGVNEHNHSIHDHSCVRSCDVRSMYLGLLGAHGCDAGGRWGTCPRYEGVNLKHPTSSPWGGSSGGGTGGGGLDSAQHRHFHHYQLRKERQSAAIEPEELDIRKSAHVAYLNSIGINIEGKAGSKGGVRLVHQAEPGNVAHLVGFAFMKRLIDLYESRGGAARRSGTGGPSSQGQSGEEEEEESEGPGPGPVQLTLHRPKHLAGTYITGGPALFGPSLDDEEGLSVTGPLVIAEPVNGCATLSYRARIRGAILVVRRGGCMFIEKARRAESAGALALIVLDTEPPSDTQGSHPFTMSGDGGPNVAIPSALLPKDKGIALEIELRRLPVGEVGGTLSAAPTTEGE